MRKFGLNCGLVIGLYLVASIAWADSLELKNGSLIKGKFMGGTESEISFQVGSSVQKYNVADIVSLKFDSERQPVTCQHGRTVRSPTTPGRQSIPARKHPPVSPSQ